MIASASPAARAFAFDRPVMQWDAPRGMGATLVRLHGSLGARELEQVASALVERAGSPRDFVVVDFENVEHLDYRALPDFARAAAAQSSRGAAVGFIGLSDYLRDLFDIAGQGPLLRRLLWQPVEEGFVARRVPDRRESIGSGSATARRVLTL